MITLKGICALRDSKEDEAAANRTVRWMRSGEFDACRKCNSTERRHMARGYCTRCYENVVYHENIDREKAKRKADRVNKNTVEREYPRVREWHVKNAEHVKAYKREWHEKNGPKPKWPIGMVVRVLVGKKNPRWMLGTIIEKPHTTTAIVKVGNGTLRVSIAKQTRIMSEEDYQASRSLEKLLDEVLP